MKPQASTTLNPASAPLRRAFLQVPLNRGPETQTPPNPASQTPPPPLSPLSDPFNGALYLFDITAARFELISKLKPIKSASQHLDGILWATDPKHFHL